MSNQVYCWQDNGAWQLGRKVFQQPPSLEHEGKVAMRLLYDPPTAPHVWVHAGKLKPYPESPILTPGG